jgi:hypothetical protein
MQLATVPAVKDVISVKAECHGRNDINTRCREISRKLLEITKNRNKMVGLCRKNTGSYVTRIVCGLHAMALYATRRAKSLGIPII